MSRSYQPRCTTRKNAGTWGESGPDASKEIVDIIRKSERYPPIYPPLILPVMAINRSELRIGSQIQHARILELHQDFAVLQLFTGAQAPQGYSQLEPLPVTESYLIIAGFERFGEGWHRAGLYLLMEHDGYYMRQDQRYVSNKPIVHVHHLENLYYALTGMLLPQNIDDGDTLTDCQP